MTLKFQVDLPKGLKGKIQPKYFQKELDKLEANIKKDLESTTEFWEHKVNFTTKQTIGGSQGSVEVETDDAIYGYLNNGTSVRKILLEQPYNRKTFPGVLKSHRAKEPTGHKARIARTAGKVFRPGIEARHWDQLIAEKYRKDPATLKGFLNSLVNTVKAMFS